ncbi:MAG: hypothetical protein DMG90_06040 [Acidobacteria bacterium]|nr:MAG: hypothetical protein DMG90_06040 [Acidobacteriota bacterium]
MEVVPGVVDPVPVCGVELIPGLAVELVPVDPVPAEPAPVEPAPAEPAPAPVCEVIKAATS